MKYVVSEIVIGMLAVVAWIYLGVSISSRLALPILI
jgi:hypothetical protein